MLWRVIILSVSLIVQWLGR